MQGERDLITSLSWVLFHIIFVQVLVADELYFIREVAVNEKKIPNKPFHSSLTYQPNQETAVAEILFLIIRGRNGSAAFVGTVTPNGERKAGAWRRGAG